MQVGRSKVILQVRIGPYQVKLGIQKATLRVIRRLFRHLYTAPPYFDHNKLITISK